MRRHYFTLLGIALLLGLVIWLNLPKTSGISIGTFYRNMEPVLGLDLRGGIQVLLEADLPAATQVDPQSMEDARQILENRSNALGVTENVFQVAGERRIVGEFPGLGDPERVVNIIKEIGLLEFVDLGSTNLPEGTIIQTDFGQTTVEPTPTPDANAPTATPLPADAPTPTAEAPATVWKTIMTGIDLKSVSVGTTATGGSEILFELTTDGARIFREYTTNNVGKYLAIVLDKKIISAPSIENPIPDGQGVITGSYTNQQANDLAVQMRYGALPIQFKVVESRVIGPTLGEDSLTKSLTAGAVGFAIVILFMAIYYRVPGLLADISILIYALIVITLFQLIPVTLTLAGIAGFLLSTGSALDANILIFERFKEELRSGRTYVQALDLAWKRALPSIRDSNIATMITCIILYWFGSQFGATVVKGFAFTLGLGIIVSLFTALVITRTFMNVVVDLWKPQLKHLKWFGVQE